MKMEALYLLVPFSVAIVFVVIWVFFRASDSGQFDDMVGPALRILQDDDRAGKAESIPAEPPLSTARVIPFPTAKTSGKGAPGDDARSA